MTMLSRLFGGQEADAREDKQFPVSRTEEEWRGSLSPEQYRVLREHGTERAGTSPLNYEKRTGTFSCAACGAPLFTS
jgi:peptide-methionine (R)-S-oxide reductase